MTEIKSSVDLAYDIALSSYDLAQKRFEAMENRIQTTIAFATGITVALCATLKGIPFRSAWFYLAVAAFVAAVATGTHARIKGSLKVMLPKELSENWLEYSEADFKKYFVKWAGEHFEENRITINHKGTLAAIMSWLFFAEAIFLAAWVLSAQS